MEWWQEIEYLLDAFGWWQISLVLIASILIGILVGLSIIYLVTRFVFKQQGPFSKLFYTLFRKKPKIFTSGDLTRHLTNTPSTHPEVHEPAKFPVPELLVEIEHNLKICNEFTGDNILPLQSDVWNAIRDTASQLPNNLREQLEKVYFDVHLLNHIVSSSAKLDYRNSVLNELYRKRIPIIAERLQGIKQNIENGALIEHVVGTEIIRDDATIQSPSDFSR
jgi:hypothetical protein